MKHKIKIIKTLSSVALLAIVSNSAWAAGTTAGTGVDNTASISYSVGGTAQTEIESSEAGNSTPGAGNGSSTSFIVDKKVDVDITAAAASQDIVPSGTASHTFTVTNEGNDIEYFNLDDVNATAGDVFDPTACTITVGTVTGQRNAIPGSDTVTAEGAIPSTASPLRLGPDGTATVTMVCTAPADNSGTPFVNGDDADVSLLATAVTTAGGTTPLTATTGADTAGKDIVLSDAAGSAAGDVVSDASHSATVANVINTAAITVRKQSSVVSDPINGTTNPKRIPEAVIRYTITVTNRATEADHIVISDIIPSDLTYVAASCSLTGDGIVNASAPDQGVALGCTESSGTVSSTSFTLPLGSTASPTTAVLTIDATIN